MVRTHKTHTLLMTLAIVAASLSTAGVARASIYWADISANTISEANSNGSHVDATFITGANGPADVLVYGNHIYWGNATGGCTESGSCPGSIGVANLNGTDVKQNLVHADTPYGLAVDGQYIYWSNFGSNTIGRANLNGTGVNQDFITGASSPDGVVVNGQHIYWSNSGDGTIGIANLNGTDPDQSFITGAGNYPTRVTVDSQHVYWTTWTSNQVPSTGTVGEANLDGTGVNNNFIHDENSPVGVAVTAGSITTCTVPRVEGKTLSAAKKALRKAHCAVGKVGYARSLQVKKGHVIWQLRAAGTTVNAGTKVGLTVSRG